jgi:hypothetical protein
MVSKPGRSRPATLSQRHVDALVRGQGDEEAARIIRSARAVEPPSEQPATPEGARPVEISADEMESIRRSGDAPATLLRRMPPARVTPSDRPATAEPPSAPSAEPPSAR